MLQHRRLFRALLRIEHPFGSVLKPVDGGGAYVRPSCAHSRPCRARRSRWSVQVATCGLLQALWATLTNRGNSRKHRSSKSEIVSAQTAASIPATCAARPGPSASVGSQSNDSATVLGE